MLEHSGYEGQFPLARVYLSQVHQCMGNHEAAIQEIEKALPSNGDAPAPILAMLGYAYGLAGRSEAAVTCSAG